MGWGGGGGVEGGEADFLQIFRKLHKIMLLSKQCSFVGPAADVPHQPLRNGITV